MPHSVACCPARRRLVSAPAASAPPMIGYVAILVPRIGPERPDVSAASTRLHSRQAAILGCRPADPSLALATTTADPVARKLERVRRHGSRDHRRCRTRQTQRNPPRRSCQPALSASSIRDLLQTAEGGVMTDPRSALSSDDRDHPPGQLRASSEEQPPIAATRRHRPRKWRARACPPTRPARGCASWDSRPRTSTGGPMASSPRTAARRPGRSSAGRTTSGGHGPGGIRRCRPRPAACRPGGGGSVCCGSRLATHSG